MRAADAARAAVAAQLGEQMSAGRLTVVEYDERLARAYAARTYGELEELTADLPRPAAQPPAPAPVEQHPAATHGWQHGGWSGGAPPPAARPHWALGPRGAPPSLAPPRICSPERPSLSPLSVPP